MSTVQVIHEHVPSVIDQPLLERKAAEKRNTVQNLPSLDLHSHKIFLIENLWQLEKLTVLRLNDNCIEKIENLDLLVNLQELNLSFNKIVKIENLEKLVNLEKLLLHANKIEILENMTELQNLQILSVSDNLIRNIENVIYLRRLKALQALSLDGNPFCKDPEYKDFILVFLPNLRYYEYNLVLKDDVPQHSHYRQLLSKVEEEESEYYEKCRLEEEKSARKELLKRAFVETIDSAVLLEPLESVTWKILTQIGGDVLSSVQKEHKDQVEKACQNLHGIAVMRLEERDTEMKLFQDCIERAQSENKIQGLKKVEEFCAPKEEICENIRNLLIIVEKKKSAEDSQEMDRVRNAANKFIDRCEKLKEDLLDLEIELQEQIEGVIADFSANMEVLINQFEHEAKQELLNLQDLEQLFHQSLIDPCLTKATNLRTQGKQSKNRSVLSAAVLKLANEPTKLMEKLIESHDDRLQSIWRQEVKLNTDCKAWLHSLIEDFKKAEFQRGRERILEISNFVSLQQEEMIDLQPGSSLPASGLL